MARKILIVDDEPVLQNMVGEMLKQAGYETFSALSCRDAVTQFQASVPDAVLLDVMLPDGDGFSLFGTLRQMRDIPVLFLSARDEDEARLRGLGLGADDYITKPFCPKNCCCAFKRCCVVFIPILPPVHGWARYKLIGAREPFAETARKRR